MAAEPIVIYASRIDLAGVADVLRAQARDVEIVGSDTDWSAAHVTMPNGARISFGHRRDYYAGPGFAQQIQGMQGYFERFPRTPDLAPILELIRSFRFALTLHPPPTPELFIESQDPRLAIVFAVTSHLDGALFTPSAMRDARGRVLYGAVPRDPSAQMPRIGRKVPSPPRAERTVDDAGTLGRDAQLRPTAERVAHRAVVLAAVAVRSMMEADLEAGPPPSDPRSEIMAWIDAAGARTELESHEQSLIEAPFGSVSRQAWINGAWQLEGLAVLSWALSLAELPAHDTTVQTDSVFRAVALSNMHRVRDVVRNARLRELAELQRCGEELFTLHWRLREFSVRPGPMPFAQVGKSAWFGPLAVENLRLIDGDLAIGNAPIAHAPREHVALCNSIAQERHKAINWLLGDSECYSQTDTST